MSCYDGYCNLDTQEKVFDTYSEWNLNDYELQMSIKYFRENHMYFK